MIPTFLSIQVFFSCPQCSQSIVIINNYVWEKEKVWSMRLHSWSTSQAAPSPTRENALRMFALVVSVLNNWIGQLCSSFSDAIHTVWPEQGCTFSTVSLKECHWARFWVTHEFCYGKHICLQDSLTVGI